MQVLPIEVDEMANASKEELQKVHNKIDRIAGELRSAINAIPLQQSKRSPWWDVGILAAVFAVPIGLSTLLEPHLHNDMKADISNEVSVQLKDPIKQISEMNANISDINGRLKILDPLVQQLITQQMQKAQSLSPKQISSIAPELGNFAHVAKSNGLELPLTLVSDTGKKLVDASRSFPDTWIPVMSFLNYKSFITPPSDTPLYANTNIELTTKYNVNPPPGDHLPKARIPAAVVPKDQAARLDFIGKDLNEGLPVGNAYIFIEGGGVILDNMDMRNVVFTNVHIVYHGGPLKMANVFFVNCRFDVDRKSNGQNFAFSFLESGASTTFTAA